jgi:hypothetical protein
VRRQELDAERAEVEARGVVLQAFVSLCRALGGGWSDADLDRAAADAAADTTTDTTTDTTISTETDQ